MINVVLNTLKSCEYKMIMVSKDRIKYDKVNGENASFYLPKQQELLVCNVANNVVKFVGNNQIEFLPIKEYLALTGKEWSKNYDCEMGDIIVVRKGTFDIVAHIDLKVADNGEHTTYFPQHRLFVGCINVASYEWFASNASGNVPHLYLCASYDGSEFVIIDAIKLAKYVDRNNINIKKVYKVGKKGELYIPSCWVFQNIDQFRTSGVLLFEKRS